MKEIPFAKKYLVSEDGNVYSIREGQPVQKASHVDTSRYHRISLVNDEGVSKKYLVHRLVATTYIPNPENKPEVNHIDGDKLHNHVSNLEWVTRKENLVHAFSINLKSVSGENNPRCQLKEFEVVEIYNFLLEGQLAKDLASRYGVKKEVIKGIKYRKNWMYLLKDLPALSVKYKSKSIADSTAHWVCSKLQEGLGVKQVLDLKTNPRLTYDIIYDIKRGRSFKHVSCNYNW